MQTFRSASASARSWEQEAGRPQTTDCTGNAVAMLRG